jgi:hypothetical protein
MKTIEAIDLVREMFASEPVLRRIDADIYPDEEEGENVLDLTLVIDGDLYEAETRLLPRIIELMGTVPEVLFDFVILPAKVKPTPEGQVIYSRDL